MEGLHAPAEHLGEPGDVLDARHRQARVLERGRRCRRSRRARSRGRRGRARTARVRSCRRRRSARAQLSHHLREQPVLDRLHALAQRLDRVARGARARARRRSRLLYRSPRRRSAPLRPPQARRRRGGLRADARRGTREAARDARSRPGPGSARGTSARSRCMYPAHTTSSTPRSWSQSAIAVSRASRSA